MTLEAESPSRASPSVTTVGMLYMTALTTEARSRGSACSRIRSAWRPGVSKRRSQTSAKSIEAVSQTPLTKRRTEATATGNNRIHSSLLTGIRDVGLSVCGLEIARAVEISFDDLFFVAILGARADDWSLVLLSPKKAAVRLWLFLPK